MKIGKNHLVAMREKVIPGWLDKCINKDFDRIVLVVGSEGVGKSTLALLLGDLIHKERKKLNGNETMFEVENNIYYDLSKLRNDVYNNAEPGDVRIIDEAVLTGGYRRDAMGRDNRSLNRVLMTCRSRNQILIFLIPSVNSVESYILERAAAVIRVVQRGHAWIYSQREKKRFITWDPRKRGYVYRDRPKYHKEMYNSVDWHLGPEVWIKYKEHKDKELNQEFTEELDSGKPEQISKRLLSRKKILEMFDISPGTYEDIIAGGKVFFKTTKGGQRRIDADSFEKALFNEE
jgi:energy-coupling factor transporter ATP-binding protein EcfA2